MAWDAVAVDCGAFDWVFSRIDFSHMVHKRLHGVHDHLGGGIVFAYIVQGV
jgi:hypothetical protein